MNFEEGAKTPASALMICGCNGDRRACRVDQVNSEILAQALREAVETAIKEEWDGLLKWKPTPHYCPDWDYLLIDKNDGEFECCLCDLPSVIRARSEGEK